MSLATPINAPLSASKIIMALCLVVAGSGFGEGRSVCSQNEWNIVLGIGEGDTPKYMCLDHTVGSSKMVAAQEQYEERIGNGETVFFGIGSFGAQAGGHMGKCYKMYLDNGYDPTIVIGQVTNFGGDIAEKQFDMQMGGGGFGVFNACAPQADYTSAYYTDGTTGERIAVRNDEPCDWATGELSSTVEPIPFDEEAIALFYGNQAQWGRRCGGQTVIEGCEYLPQWPADLPAAEREGKKDLRELCEYAFTNKVRRTKTYENGNQNQGIHTIVRIYCPDELVDITKLRRTDDKSFLDETGEEKYQGEGQYLTSTMDCCASASTDSINTSQGTGIDFEPGLNVLPSCSSSGYI